MKQKIMHAAILQLRNSATPLSDATKAAALRAVDEIAWPVLTKPVTATAAYGVMMALVGGYDGEVGVLLQQIMANAANPIEAAFEQ